VARQALHPLLLCSGNMAAQAAGAVVESQTQARHLPAELVGDLMRLVMQAARQARRATAPGMLAREAPDNQHRQTFSRPAQGEEAEEERKAAEVEAQEAQEDFPLVVAAVEELPRTEQQAAQVDRGQTDLPSSQPIFSHGIRSHRS
jgi:hypothetical protein